MIDNALFIPPRPDGWTVDEVLALPEDQTLLQRVELVDGVLLVGPWPGLEHQRFLQKLLFAFAPALPDGTLFELQGDEYHPIAKSDETDIELTRPFAATIRLA
ncbi:hypothetical protein ILP97_22410 [Amycolatopsis sp. H6(2020)]|nr:hypothetical protein [Amycolatopsis sp. H6(2020)]